jgi:hypothetical protein
MNIIKPCPVLLYVLAILFTGCGSPGSGKEKPEDQQTSENQPEEEWVQLFDGKSFDGWISVKTGEVPRTGWNIENGEIVMSGFESGATEKAGDIITRKKYSDFELEFEWKLLTEGGNSGVKYFVNFYGDEGKGPALGLEYQILDDDNHPSMLDGRMKPGDYHTVAGCYELYAPVNKQVSALGEWNSSKVISKDGHVEHWLNGKKVLEFDRFSTDFKQRVAKSKFKDRENFGRQESGHILLQDHPGITHFRNIRIREL